MEIKEQIEEILSELKSTNEIESSLVIRKDGVIVASDMPNLESKNISSIIYSLMGAAETTSLELKRGVFQELVIESEKGKIIAVNAGKMAVLVALMKKEGNLGFVLISLERAAKRIEEIIG